MAKTRVIRVNNPDGSCSLVANRKLLPGSVLPWPTISLHWQRIMACRSGCVKSKTEDENGRPWPPVRYLRDRDTTRSSVAPENGAEPPRSAGGSSTITKFPLSDLPTEIQLEIFRLAISASEPHTLDGVFYWGSPEMEQAASRPSLVFWECRTWRDVPYFQLCRASREEAILAYGNPATELIPFNPNVDRVRLHAVEQFGWQGSCRALEHKHRLSSVSSTTDQVWVYPRMARTSNGGSDQRPEPCILSNSCGRCPSRSMTGKQGQPSFLTHLTQLDVKISPVYAPGLRREIFWRFVAHMCPELQVLKLLTASTDRCDQDPNFVAEQEDDLGEDWWQLEDLIPLRSLLRSMRDPGGGGAVDIFSSVRTFELCLMDSICRRDMTHWAEMQEGAIGGKITSRSEYFDGPCMSPVILREVGNNDLQ
ncbi:unnamed protein product [Clonostachys rosea]|uniref:F-box domain-containing protein n=1 Tax=Bionectria ochroleuca TaxID=29856 RepID=A0ABY6TN87_BIOOC|nr:unnamed protein product [Clonostachys rosea]